MVTLDEVLAAALRRYSTQSGVARAVGRTRAAVNTWYLGSSKPDYAACIQLASATALPARAVLEAAGHDASEFPDSATKNKAESLMVARQRALRDRLDRWVGVLGPRMGDEAAEDFFWESLKQHADTTLAALSFGIAVNPPPGGAVKTAISQRSDATNQPSRTGKRGLRGDLRAGSLLLAALLGNVNVPVAA